jgi:hypothetical protein
VHFQHSAEIWRDFPELVPGIMYAEGITWDVSVGARTARFTAVARSRLAERLNGNHQEAMPERRMDVPTGLL